MPGDALVVTVTLATPPVWYEPDYWSTHAFDSFDPTGPYAVKPKFTVEARYDETLAEVIDRATEGLGLCLGPAHERYLIDRVSQWLVRLGFYRPEDESAFDEQRMYGWPYLLPIAKEGGLVERIPWREATYRELVVSSSLGLIEGDVLRPYVSGSMPQGSAHEATEAARLTADAIRQAYALLPQARRTVDDVIRLAFVAGAVKALRSWRQRRFQRRADKRRLKDSVAEAKRLGYLLVVGCYEFEEADGSLRYYAEAAKLGEAEPTFLCNAMTPGFAASEGVKALKLLIEIEGGPAETGDSTG